MRVVRVGYTKTRQVRQFEPERIELDIELQEGDTVQGAIAAARATVCREWDQDAAELHRLQERIKARGKTYDGAFD